MTDEDKKLTAWHEAGHALVNVLLEHTHPLHKVTIIPRGPVARLDHVVAEGGHFELPHARKCSTTIADDDGRTHRRGNRFRRYFHRRGDATSSRPRSMARAMVCQWGMSDKLGMVQYGEDDEYVFLGRDMMRSQDYSEATAQEIDAEVKRIIDDGYNTRAEIIISQPRQAGNDRQRAARIRNARRRAGGGHRATRANLRRRRRRPKWNRRPVRRRHAAAGSAAQTRAAEIARSWHARAGGGLNDYLGAGKYHAEAEIVFGLSSG